MLPDKVKELANIVQATQDITQSQDVTTIPDTQEQGTQDGDKSSGRDRNTLNINNQQPDDISVSSQVAHVDDEEEVVGDESDVGKNGKTSGDITAERDGNGEKLISVKRAFDGSPILDDAKRLKIDTSNQRGGQCFKPEIKDVAPKSNLHSEALWFNMLRKSENNNPNKKAAQAGIEAKERMTHIEKGKEDKSRCKETNIDIYPETLTAKKLNTKLVSDTMIRTARETVLSPTCNIKQTDSGYEAVSDFTGQSKSRAIADIYSKKQTAGMLPAHGKKSLNDESALLPGFSIQNRNNIDTVSVISPKLRSSTEIGYMTSPPHLPIPGETWYNVSPTATSMSSDVFMVKAKELQKRMKRRAAGFLQNTGVVLSQNPGLCVSQNTGFGLSQNTGLHMAKLDTTKCGYPTEENSIACPIAKMPQNNRSSGVVDTVNEAIDSVIEKARNMADAEKEKKRSKYSKPLPQPLKTAKFNLHGPDSRMSNFKSSLQNDEITKNPLTNIGMENLTKVMFLKPQPVSATDLATVKGWVSIENYLPPLKTLSTSQAVPEDKTVDSSPVLIQSGDSIELLQKDTVRKYPPLKELVQTGRIQPGENVLSVNARGCVWTASLRPPGKIWTPTGAVFSTPMQWLSSLSDGEMVKKSKAYQEVMYKGNPLAILDSGTNPQSVTKSVQGVTITTGGVETCNQATLTSSRDATPETPAMSADEQLVNKLLSTCVIRLLSKRDLVPCDDLPDNFWTEDYAKVKLHSDIWDCVDAW